MQTGTTAVVAVLAVPQSRDSAVLDPWTFSPIMLGKGLDVWRKDASWIPRKDLGLFSQSIEWKNESNLSKGRII